MFCIWLCDLTCIVLCRKHVTFLCIHSKALNFDYFVWFNYTGFSGLPVWSETNQSEAMMHWLCHTLSKRKEQKKLFHVFDTLAFNLAFSTASLPISLFVVVCAHAWRKQNKTHVHIPKVPKRPRRIFCLPSKDLNSHKIRIN